MLRTGRWLHCHSRGLQHASANSHIAGDQANTTAQAEEQGAHALGSAPCSYLVCHILRGICHLLRSRLSVLRHLVGRLAEGLQGKGDVRIIRQKPLAMVPSKQDVLTASPRQSCNSRKGMARRAPRRPSRPAAQSGSAPASRALAGWARAQRSARRWGPAAARRTAGPAGCQPARGSGAPRGAARAAARVRARRPANHVQRKRFTP